jgi:hypothetical protein
MDKKCSFIVAIMSAARGTCLLSRYPETGVAWTTENTVLLLLSVLPSNGSCLQGHHLAMGLYATLLLPEHPSFLDSWHSLFLALSLTTVSITPCRIGKVSHPSAGSSQLLPGPAIALGPFLRLTMTIFS